jgi:hypothetical protein
MPTSVTLTASGAPAVARIAGAGKYPAPEADVFTFLEGAFYGNLFEPDRLTWSCELDDAGAWKCSGGAVTTADIESCGLGRAAGPSASVAAPAPGGCRGPGQAMLVAGPLPGCICLLLVRATDRRR